MQRELSHLSEIVRANTLEAAWNGVVALARDAGVAALVKTRYRQVAQSGGDNGIRLELAGLYLDPALSSRPVAIPAAQESLPPPTALWTLAPTNSDSLASPCGPDGLPAAAQVSREAADPFIERFSGILRDSHGIRFSTILTVPGTPVIEGVVAEFLNFFATDSLAPEAISLLGTGAGAYAGKAAVLASRDEAERDVTLRPQEIECIRWAVAGKSLQDIADITGLSYRSVRYQIDQARERYGYATNLQTFVRAAVDYGLDPLLSPPLKSRP